MTLGFPPAESIKSAARCTKALHCSRRAGAVFSRPFDEGRTTRSTCTAPLLRPHPPQIVLSSPQACRSKMGLSTVCKGPWWVDLQGWLRACLWSGGGLGGGGKPARGDLQNFWVLKRRPYSGRCLGRCSLGILARFPGNLQVFVLFWRVRL